MLNSPWPSLIWQLYDYYYITNGAFHGSQIANEPLHIQYSYDDHSIWVINTSLEKKMDLRAKIVLLNFRSEEIFNQTIEPIILEPNSRLNLNVTLPENQNEELNTFLILYLEDNHQQVSRNLYWLSKQPDVFEDKDEWYYTPLKQHADMKSLQKLPTSTIKSTQRLENDQLHITIENISQHIAFFIRIDVLDKASLQVISPIFWTTNYISLVPQEKITVIGRLPKNFDINNIDIKMTGWNCKG